MKSNIYISLIIVVLAVSCKTEIIEEDTRKSIAKLNSKYLYLEDVYIPENITDTSAFLDLYSKKWIKNQLLFKEAKKSLQKENKEDFNKLVFDYKQQLYINAYKEVYIKHKLDTVINNIEINKIYNKNIANYKLDKNIVKATYIKLPHSAPKIYNVRKWIRSKKPESLELLNTYCTQYSEKFYDFEGEWIELDEILKFFPKKIHNQKSTLKYRTFIEARDSSYQYFIDIDAYKLINDTMPVYFVKDEIVDEIILKRKKELIISLRENIYEDALKQKQIELFNLN